MLLHLQSCLIENGYLRVLIALRILIILIVLRILIVMGSHLNLGQTSFTTGHTGKRMFLKLVRLP